MAKNKCWSLGDPNIYYRTKKRNRPKDRFPSKEDAYLPSFSFCALIFSATFSATKVPTSSAKVP